MPSFIADLHIHSRFSMATSKQLNIPHLTGWAMVKGINVLGTGDFTHPAWRAELRRDLIFDEESGLYTPKPDPEAVLPGFFTSHREKPLFCLQTEISSIYKKNGRVRKNHNVILMPTLEDVDKFSEKLSQIGNISSDGRPILGLDAKDLLDLVLNISDRAVLIPAHIWTPWFSLFGSKSGFDDIHECFEDLTDHIFALETGLSSDPSMNRLVSALDGYALISNSDAHSGPNLGREANVFQGRPSYDGMIEALRRQARRTPDLSPDAVRFEGTLEIYPEEGKYHLDGHRACGVVMTPEEAEQHNNICPVCGKPLTIGVMHRVWDLADRSQEPDLKNEPAVYPIIPLPKILSELYNSGSTTKKVQEAFAGTLQKLGSEFSILSQIPVDEIRKTSERLGEAIARIREGKLIRNGGYDGEFGTVVIFSDQEKKEMAIGRAGRLVPENLRKEKPRAQISAAGSLLSMLKEPGNKVSGTDKQAVQKFHLTDDQERACRHRGAPLLVLAGPGTGKTRLLTERIVYLLRQGTSARHITALTFSKRAAEEINQRLRLVLPEKTLPECTTFHALAWRLLRETQENAVLLTDASAHALMKKAVLSLYPNVSQTRLSELIEQIEFSRETCANSPDSAEEKAFLKYRSLQREISPVCVDFTGLLEWLREACEKRTITFQPEEILVDEIQDLSPLQTAILKAMLPEDGTGFFGIGDPDQAIYSFRGSSGNIRRDLQTLWPALETLTLKQSFRSSQKILSLAGQAMLSRPASGILTAVRQLEASLKFFEAPSETSEAVWVADKISALLGSMSHSLLDTQKKEQTLSTELSPSDIAILVRIKAQIPALASVLRARGIPVQIPSDNLFWEDEQTEKILTVVSELLETQEHAGTADSALEPWISLIQNQGSPLPPEIIEKRLSGISAAMPVYFASTPWKQLTAHYKKEGSWQKLLESIRWLSETEMLREKAESVRILTIHAAKGLEFRAVFMPGMEDGLLPLDQNVLFGKSAHKQHSDTEEERRLLYVGLTRASEALFLSRASQRHIYGKEISLKPSRFLREIMSDFQKTHLEKHSRHIIRQRGLLD